MYKNVNKTEESLEANKDNKPYKSAKKTASNSNIKKSGRNIRQK